MKKMCSTIAMCIALCILSWDFNLTAFAQTVKNENFSIQPTFQDITIIDSDIKKVVSFEISNSTQEEQQFIVEAIDIRQTDAQGTISFIDKPVQGNEYSLAKYISIPSEKVTIGSGKTETVFIHVENRQDLSPGGHYAAILFKAIPKNTEDQQQIVPALSSFLLVKKQGGERFNLSLLKTTLVDSIEFMLPTKGTLEFANEGNVHLIPRGTVSVHDLFGRSVLEATINENSSYVLPGNRREIAITFRQIRASFPVMLYTVTTQGNGMDNTVNFNQSDTFIFVSPFFAVGLGISVGIGLWGMKRYRKQ